MMLRRGLILLYAPASSFFASLRLWGENNFMASFVVDGAQLWIGDGTQIDGHLIVENGVIREVASGRYSGSLPVTLLDGLALSPGLIDSMVTGAFGKSAGSGKSDDLLHIGREYLKHGVTAYQACLGSLPADDIERSVTAVRNVQHQESPAAARVLGLYLEGPFIQDECSGGNLPDLGWPVTEKNIQHALDNWRGAVTMINVSPGIEGDTEAVRRFSEAGLVVTMAHSNADDELVRQCVAAGTRVLGHAWDNNKGRHGDSGLPMPTIEHVALLDERVQFIHLIADGHHVHPLWIELTLRCRGTEALVLVSDALQCAGCPDGTYTYDDGQLYEKKGGVGRRLSDGGLFGGAMLVSEMFRNFVRLTRTPPYRAIRTVTFNPAKSLGIETQIGILQPGCAADLVAWDEFLTVRRVWRQGQPL